jgi:hypothetical protein
MQRAHFTGEYEKPSFFFGDVESGGGGGERQRKRGEMLKQRELTMTSRRNIQYSRGRGLVYLIC